MRDLDSEPESGTDCLRGGGFRGLRVRHRQDKRNSVPNPLDDIRSKSKSPVRGSLLTQNLRREQRGFRRRLNFSSSSNSLKSLQLVLNQESVLAHRRASQPLDAMQSIDSRDAFPDSLSSISSSSSSNFEDDEDILVPLRQPQRRKAAEVTIADLAFENLDAKVVDVLARMEREAVLKNGARRRRERVAAAKMNGAVKHEVVTNGAVNGKVQQKEVKQMKNNVPSKKPIERREHLYKILVIGELGTGKTSIIKRYVHQFFSQHYRATIGVDFALKVLNWDSDSVVRLQLWDIAGQERFGNMTRVYYKEAVGAFLVFDVTRAATFDAVHKWKADLDAKVQLPDGSPIPCILLANKCDQPKEGIVASPSKLDDFVREKGFAGWFETSAKENVNIEEAATTLVKTIMENDKLMNHQDCLDDNNKFSLRDHEDGRNRLQKACNC